LEGCEFHLFSHLLKFFVFSGTLLLLQNVPTVCQPWSGEE
jgi:hypothetical protein